MMLPSIGVMILNCNGKEWLAPLYESLRKQKYPRLKVYLVDNGSNDDSVSLTSAQYPEVKIIRFSQNIGYCMAYNRAMPHVFKDGCEWVVWSNNDVLLVQGCLLEMAKAAGQSERIGVVGPSFFAWDSDEPNYYMKGKHPAAIVPMRGGSTAPFDVDWVEGSFLMVSETCIADVGWLDPYLFFYWEEADFCRRALRKGWRVVLAPRAVARHYAGGSSPNNQKHLEAAKLLKSRNQYIYSLADPNHSVMFNIVNTIHLFLVLCKESINRSPAALRYEIRAFCNLISELGQVMHKWRRDRKMISPGATAPGYAQVSMEALGGMTSARPHENRRAAEPHP